MTKRTCSVEGCERRYKGHGFCELHLRRWRKTGDPLRLKYLPLAERFWAKVRKTDTCWLWIAGRDKRGYGHFGRDRGETRLAHRIAYEWLVGPIPEGLELDHLCRNPTCVNPAHLEPVSHTENVRRGSRARKTHCVNGHEFTPENTYRNSSGHRRCRACSLERSRLAYLVRRQRRSAQDLTVP